MMSYVAEDFGMRQGPQGMRAVVGPEDWTALTSEQQPGTSASETSKVTLNDRRLEALWGKCRKGPEPNNKRNNLNTVSFDQNQCYHFYGIEVIRGREPFRKSMNQPPALQSIQSYILTLPKIPRQSGIINLAEHTE